MGLRLRSRARALAAGWYWILGLLVLPNCGFSSQASSLNLDAGPLPRDSAVFCDIEKPSGRHCSTEMERTIGIRLSDAAVALNEGRTSSLGLDDSPDALARCGGQPETIEFQGAFPEGYSVCVNCGSVVGTPRYPDVNAACRAQCYDFFGSTASDGSIIPQVPPDPSVKSFCDASSRASTNFPLDGCFAGACSEAGALRPDFADPRRVPEPVAWTDFIGTAAGGAAGDLVRTAPFTTDFDAGAASSQRIARGDAYVEFSVQRADEAHMLGLTQLSAACGPSPACPDTDPTFTDIDFAIALGLDGRFYVFEKGVQVPGPAANGSFGTYSAGERFRVNLQDRDNGTATVTYARLVGPCTPGTLCNTVVFFTHTGAPASYPLRVDASIREPGATLTDVRLVRIQ